MGYPLTHALERKTRYFAAMSQENVEIARAALEAWNAGDMEALRELYHPNVIVRMPDDWPEPGPFVGRDAVWREIEQLRDTWDADTFEQVSDFIDVGDRVAVRYIWRSEGRGPESNIESTHVFTVRKQKILGVEFFWDHAEALETLGLREESSQKNVDLTRAYFEAIARASREDFDTEATISKMAEFFDPEIEWDTSAGPVLEIAGVYRGIEDTRQWCREWFTAWQALHFEYEVVDAGDRVVTLLDLRMRGRSSGIEVPFGKHAWITTFKDGLMIHNKLYMNQAEALEAAGLSE
jgi:ketosteroid isomerase-like protein